MSASFASVTEFECHDWSCRRQATTYNFRSPQSYKDEGKSMAELFAQNILCNIHAGVIKRQKNGRNSRYYVNENLVLISELGSHWDEAKAAYLKARTDANAAAQAAAAAKRAEAQQVANARFAEAWVERSTEAPFIIEPDKERRSYEDRFRDGYIVRKDNEGAGSWDSTAVDVEQDGRAPAVVSIRSNGRMSPNKARALAQALILAANKADERDLINGPR